VLYEGFPGMRLDDPEGVKDFFTYSYEHLDDISFMKAPEAVFEDEPLGSRAVLKEAVGARLREAGWEGDGQLEVFWLPPFADVGIEDTWGTYVWCVKQDNNGTSWLACKYALSFKRLAFQNEELPYETHLQAGIMFLECSSLVRQLRDRQVVIKQRLHALSELQEPIASEIGSELLTSAQGSLVAEFNEFLDGSFLSLLDEILGHGNSSNLKLNKLKANLEPKRYLMDEEDDVRVDVDGARWLTMRGVIRDIWISYKFEPFLQKLGLLFKACEFAPTEPALVVIKKHIQLRNCVQHHDRRVTKDALQTCGVEKFDVKENDGTHTDLVVCSEVRFTLAELERFNTAMEEIANEFYAHTAKKIRRKMWVPRNPRGRQKASSN